KLDKQAFEQLDTISKASIYPQQILSFFNQDSSVITKSQDIYNARKKLCHEYLQGRMPIQALLDDLKKGPFEIDKPKLVVTDHELGLVNALEQDKWAEFLKGWTSVINSKTEKDFVT
ncbi:14037_t:CDS:2, partial [Cetraspora pellucida]